MSTGTRLFVSNLPDNADENDLRSAFSEFGEVKNLDIKSKSGPLNEQKKFAFVTLSASNYDVESCIKYFTSEEYKGNKLHVTRARESFLERLQREREQAQKKETEKNQQQENLPIRDPVIRLSNKLNPQKRKLDNSYSNDVNNENTKATKSFERNKYVKQDIQPDKGVNITEPLSEKEKKKFDSEKKRIESMKKKRQEFNAKRMIIKTGLIDVDKVPNKKVIFSDNEEESPDKANGHVKMTRMQDKNNTLFDDEDSGDDVNFEVKKQFEGKKGQKVLDLQSRYKSDKRFMLDERFMDNDNSEGEEQKEEDNNEQVDLSQMDEKAKQYDILQNVLGISIKQKNKEFDSKKIKPKLGMLRFDPSQPEHARFLMPAEETKQEQTKKNKKKKGKKEEIIEDLIEAPVHVIEKVEVSKEQFYKVSDTLKEAIAQPTTFSLRSLFVNNEDVENGAQDQDTDYIPLKTQSKPKIKNPLNPGEKNPFVYDSSDSETEEVEEVKPEELTAPTESKAVWKENLFFSKTDNRLTEGLAFFNNTRQSEGPKERRELKSLMKKRLYNNERKNQMFQKKIGGRKSLKKNYRKKS